MTLIPPCFSKTTNERLFEKLIDGELQFLAQFTCWLTNIPFVDIDGCDSSHCGQAHRIERTRNGFLPMKASIAIGRINGAESTCPLVLDKHTIFLIDNLGDKFAITVGIDHAFTLNLLDCLRGEIIVYCLISLFKQGYFIGGDWRASISFYATGTVTLIEVATEKDLEEVERHECAKYFYHVNSSRFS